MIISVNTSNSDYDVIIENGILNNLEKYIPDNQTIKTLLVTDDGVPIKYVLDVKNKIKITGTVILKHGEENKTLDSVTSILDSLYQKKFCRTDRIIALGGGVVGDLAGFAASVYMRGIDYINLPTTLLSQVDSSIGGKTGFDFRGHKNLVGSFYPPKKVIIDPLLTLTQNKRNFYSGMIEALKMSLCYNKSLYCEILSYSNISQLEHIISESLLIKKRVVEIDEKENGIRRILNFGHTIGHAIELSSRCSLCHGECVAIGMLPLVPENIKKELTEIYRKWQIPYNCTLDVNDVIDNIFYDKKTNCNGIETVFLEDYEKPFTKTLSHDDLKMIIIDFYESRFF